MKQSSIVSTSFQRYVRTICAAFCLFQLTAYASAQDLEGIRQLAEQGQVAAQVKLGTLYARGLGGIEENPQQSLIWYTKAAEQGNADAKNAVAELVNRKAAENGDASAQYKLGRAYAMGGVFKQDPKLAMAWNRKAAENGNADAQFDLGANYDQGYMVEKDPAHALAWFRKAAEQDHTDAQYVLGVAYAQGKGVPQDINQALQWFRQAAKKGNVAAQRYIDQLGG